MSRPSPTRRGKGKVGQPLKGNEPRKPMTVNVRPALVREVDRRAQAVGISRSDAAEQALERWLQG